MNKLALIYIFALNTLIHSVGEQTIDNSILSLQNTPVTLKKLLSSDHSRIITYQDILSVAKPESIIKIGSTVFIQDNHLIWKIAKLLDPETCSLFHHNHSNVHTQSNPAILCTNTEVKEEINSNIDFEDTDIILLDTPDDTNTLCAVSEYGEDDYSAMNLLNQYIDDSYDLHHKHLLYLELAYKTSDKPKIATSYQVLQGLTRITSYFCEYKLHMDIVRQITFEEILDHINDLYTLDEYYEKTHISLQNNTNASSLTQTQRQVEAVSMQTNYTESSSSTKNHHLTTFLTSFTPSDLSVIKKYHLLLFKSLYILQKIITNSQSSDHSEHLACAIINNGLF